MSDKTADRLNRFQLPMPERGGPNDTPMDAREAVQPPVATFLRPPDPARCRPRSGAARAESDVVDQDDQDVRRALRDGKEVASGRLLVTTPIRLAQGGAMLVGADTGSAITPEYEPPFRFTGRIRRVIVDVSGEHVVDHEAEMRVALAKQ